MLEYFIYVQFAFLLKIESRLHLKCFSRMLPVYLLKLLSEPFKIKMKGFLRWNWAFSDHGLYPVLPSKKPQSN